MPNISPPDRKNAESAAVQDRERALAAQRIQAAGENAGQHCAFNLRVVGVSRQQSIQHPGDRIVALDAGAQARIVD